MSKNRPVKNSAAVGMSAAAKKYSRYSPAYAAALAGRGSPFAFANSGCKTPPCGVPINRYIAKMLKP